LSNSFEGGASVIATAANLLKQHPTEEEEQIERLIECEEEDEEEEEEDVRIDRRMMGRGDWTSLYGPSFGELWRLLVKLTWVNMLDFNVDLIKTGTHCTHGASVDCLPSFTSSGFTSFLRMLSFVGDTLMSTYPRAMPIGVSAPSEVAVPPSISTSPGVAIPPPTLSTPGAINHQLPSFDTNFYHPPPPYTP
jgi:hypothetical protein